MAIGDRHAGKQAGDEEARDDEENVDPYIAAGKSRGPEVENHHESDGNAAQPLNLGPESVFFNRHGVVWSDQVRPLSRPSAP